MLLTFLTRMQSIVVAPKFYEFDPYFDMMDSQYILTYGHQLLLDPSSLAYSRCGHKPQASAHSALP